MDKYVYITDIHLSSRTPVSRNDNMRLAILNKLDYVVRYCVKRKCKKILIGGDIFESPNIEDEVFNLFVEKFHNAYVKFGIEVWTIIGNHDLTGKNLETFKNGKVGSLYYYEWFHLLNEEPISGKFSTVYGYDYTKELENGTDYPDSAVELDFDKVNIGVFHTMVYNGETKIIDGVPILVDYRDVVTSFDIVLCGHYHPGFGKKKTNILEHETWFVNPGSLARADILCEAIGYGPALAYIKIGASGVPKIYMKKIPCEKDVFEIKDKKINLDEEKRISFIRALKNFKSGDLRDTGRVRKVLYDMVGNEELDLGFKVTKKLVDFIMERVEKNNARNK